jgi:uncharacterized membrane protein
MMDGLLLVGVWMLIVLGAFVAYDRLGRRKKAQMH